MGSYIFIVMIIVSALTLTGCGGGGGDNGGSNGSSSTVGVAKQGVWIGKYSSIDTQTSGAYYSDIELAGSSLNKMYVNGYSYGTFSQSIPFLKEKDLAGNAYQSSDGYSGIYFDDSGNHMGMIYGSENIAVYQADSMEKIVAKKEDIDGVWSGSFFAKSNRDGAVHQFPTSVSCQYQICTFDQGAVVIDFAKQYYSKFYTEGTWYGREANSGSRYLVTALMSEDLQFMTMSLCWSSFPLSYEGFFDICQAAVLSKVSPTLVNTANAGINQNSQIGNLITLDGSGSTTSTGTGALSYLWRIISKPAGSSIQLSSTGDTKPTFTADVRGTYIFGLTVSNSGFSSTESTVTITVTAPILIPPKLTNFKATGAINTVVITWDNPNFANLAYVEIYRNSVDDLSSAIRIGTTNVTNYTDIPSLEMPFSGHYYWARIVSIGDFNNDSIVGQFNSTAGTRGVALNAP